MQNESSGKKALRAGLGYTIGNILVKGLTFISIPIFARLLSVADYGLYNTFGSYVTIMTFVVGLTLHTSVRNAKLDFPDRIDAFCSSVTIIILLNTALLAVLSVIFAGAAGRGCSASSSRIWWYSSSRRALALRWLRFITAAFGRL